MSRRMRVEFLDLTPEYQNVEIVEGNVDVMDYILVTHDLIDQDAMDNGFLNV